MWEIAVHPAVAGDVFDGVLFVLSLFPRDVLDETWDLIGTDFDGFPTYFSLSTGIQTSCFIGQPV